jgi:hypothetical protein
MKIEQPNWLSIVREKVESLRYGVVQIVIHDSRVTLIERTEKTRLTSSETETFDRPDKLEASKPIRTSHRTTG